MQRTKLLILALVSVFAMSGLTAVSALAAEEPPEAFEFLGTATEWTGKQTNTHAFTGNAGKVECTEAEFKGPVPTGKTAATVNANTIIYKNCKAFSFVGATVKVEHCEYHFHEPLDTEGEPPTFADRKHEGQVDLLNAPGFTCKLTVSVSGTNCVITFNAQNNLSKVNYSNLPVTPPFTELEVEAALKNIKYTQAGSQCTGGQGTFTNGEYSGKVLVKNAWIN